MEPKRIVESGYDAIADTHLDWLRRIDGDPRMRFVEELLDRLPEPVPIVDLGCGAGVPCTAALAERHDVLGVDVSTATVRRPSPVDGAITHTISTRIALSWGK